MSLEGHFVGRSKRILARITNGLALDTLLIQLQRVLFSQRYIRAVNYHNIPRFTAGTFESHLRYYQKYFSSVSYTDLHQFLSDGKWYKEKPGLIISFDDGLRCHYEIATPLIEKYGYTGWFFVPTGFVDAPPNEQQTYAASHNIKYTPEFDDPRVALSWDELQILDDNHVVGCHTRSHYRIRGTETDEELKEELVYPKQHIEQKIQREISTFSWVGGEESSYSVEAASCIEEAEYRYSFGTSSAPILTNTHPLQLHRTNIESSWPLDIVKFQLSGLIDLKYRGKRRRVDKLTASANEMQSSYKH